VARGLKRCFGLDTAIVTALVDNPVGRLVQDLIYQGGVDASHLRWVKDDGVGRAARNGLNFTERGFGVRAALGCSDRGHTAVSQLKPGDVDWESLFGTEGARWFHTGGIFTALSETTPHLAKEAMAAARRHGTIVSYDLNYRPSLWKSIGGQKRAQEVNRELAPLVDVMLGNEEDFTAALGFAVEGLDENLSALDPGAFRKMIEQAVKAFPNFAAVATTLRNARTATINDWGRCATTTGGSTRPEPGGAGDLRRVGGATPSPPASSTASSPQGRPVGGGVRSGPRSARHDHARRHHHGHPGRGGAGHEGGRRPGGALSRA